MHQLISFSPSSVPTQCKDLEDLVDLARLSSSGGNIQPLAYYLSSEPSSNDKIFSTLHWAGYLTDWSGPYGRLGRLSFRMKTPVFPGDEMRFSGLVSARSTDAAGCCWAEVDLAITVDGTAKTTGKARIALPAHAQDNPWQRKGERWKP